MKSWLFLCHDPRFEDGMKSGLVNGGTSVIYHMNHTLDWMGYQSRMIAYDSKDPFDADIIFIQSEWVGAVEEKLEAARKNGSKVVVWLGHFIGGNYSDPTKIKADLYVTTWKGELLEAMPYHKKIVWFPHAYCPACDKDTETPKHKLFWVGNNYPLRDESWFDGLPNITRLSGVRPEMLGSHYRRSTVCLNLHGDFQKGIVATHDSRLADKPGFAVNERLFQIAGASAFQVCDWSPMIDELYADDELVKCRTKEDYQRAVLHFLAHPDERDSFIIKGNRRTQRDHTYPTRLYSLMKML